MEREVHTRPFMKGNLYIKFEVGEGAVCSALSCVVLLVGGAWGLGEGGLPVCGVLCFIMLPVE
jgi:hypothetical protein